MGIVEIPKWLKGLPLAPEFRPTDTEFADPIAYISKIEKEASAFGICKIIPPLPKPSKKYVFSNLNKSLVKCPDLGGDVDISNFCSLPTSASADISNDGRARSVFTTRQQELGQDNKKMKGAFDVPHVAVHKQVWQSGEIYTLEQFESKAKTFARSILGMIKEVSPLVIESLFWKATSEKPIYVEYANDVPGSGFGEPEGQFRYFHRRMRRRRKRTSYRRGENSDCKNSEVDTEKDLAVNDIKDVSAESDSNASIEASKLSRMINGASHESCHSGQKEGNANNDLEGTAGWKLSNSPWNLQVIARSPGSLTRFMPDDIPGVTSPMVYIGMLFSWFAWHVEDHELHSMNFLHTGSPKTWYAVPGDCAFAFEEVIRTEAYGGNIDRLAALSLLGEKTTLLSPELIIGSGIPCCRLIQNPGEFVVTFPRAYHVGFSHGFNCGEAANFGTPQWLKVAKEAAIRRAAMNYLPMLSHQQLLYLLTMSFVSRVPRSLLPGARSSRLRDRLKEERELLVKKAFIEDMLHENKLLSFLLGRQSKYRAVLWHPDSLPCMSKDSEMLNRTETISITQQEQASDHHPENNSKHSSLLDEMRLYMETLNDLYLNDVDDDLSCEFQIDSGTLACVACGILGYPFMSVVQPCARASMDIQSASDISCQGRGDSDHKDCPPLSDHGCGINPITEGPNYDAGVSLLPRDAPLLDQGWNTSIKFLRPRVFCLEHAVQIEDLLQTKGGVQVMVICHSDYQKVKAHASAVAKEIGSPFNCEDLSLDMALQEDLNLINLAIDDEDDCEEDWTTRLGFNLRHCVKVRKTSTFKQVQHALPLEGLFHYKSCNSNFDITWQSRRCRSKVKSNHPRNLKLCTNVDSKMDSESSRTDGNITKKEKLIQYSRRNKPKPDDLTGASRGQWHIKDQSGTIVAATSEFLYEHGRDISNQAGISELGKSKSDSPAGGVTELKNEVQVLETIRSTCLVSSPSNVVILTTGDNLVVEDVEKVKSQTLTELCMDGEIAHGNVSRNAISLSNFASSFAANQSVEHLDAQRKDVVIGTSCIVEGLSDLRASANVVQLATAQSNIGESISYEDEVVSKKKSAFPHKIHDNLATIHAAEGFSCNLSLGYSANGDRVEQVLSSITAINQPAFLAVIENPEVVDELCTAVGLHDSATSDNEAQQTEIQATNAIEEVLSCSSILMAVDLPSTVSREECSGVTKNSCSEELHDDMSLCVATPTQIHETEEMNEDGVICDSDLKIVKGPTSQLVETLSAVSNVSCAEGKPSPIATAGNDKSMRKMNEESCSRCVSQSTTVPMGENDRIQMEISATLNSSDGSDSCMLQHELLKGVESATSCPYMKNGRKRMRQGEKETEQKISDVGFIRSPCEGLRPRAQNKGANEVDVSKTAQKKLVKSDIKMNSISSQTKKAIRKGSHRCDIDGCRMSFGTKEELRLHKRNQCPQEDCGKKFRSHKYAVLHQRVHDDDRPLKCPWKGCSMSFKWAWARTEHIRVHTGERPYKCKVEGCGLSFRFVSDFSRHRRKTGHYMNSQPESSPHS